MTMTTRVISFDLLDPAGVVQQGQVTFTMNVPELIDTADNAIYVQKPETYSLAVGQSDALITTDNANTSPASGQWGYDVIVKLQPGVPSINVTDAKLPSGGGAYSLAAMIQAAQVVD